MKDTSSEKTVNALIDELTKVRKKKGISHEKLSKAAGIHRSTVSLIESKDRIPTILTCLRIADALEVSLGELLVKVSKSK